MTLRAMQQRATAKRIATTQNLQKAIQTRLKQQISSALESRLTSRQELTLRDRVLESRMAAIRDATEARKTLSEDQQLAMDKAISMADELQIDTSLMDQRDEAAAAEASKVAARAVLDELRQTAYQQSLILASDQINRLRLVSQAEKTRIFNERARQIANDLAMYERTREMNALQDIMNDINENVIMAVQKHSVETLISLAQINTFVPILETQMNFAASQVNAATAYIAQNIMAAVYDAQGLSDSQVALFNQISNVVMRAAGLATELQGRIASIQTKDASLPGLESMRKTLVDQLGPLQMEVNGLLDSISKTPNPSKEADAVADFLRGVRDGISGTAQGLFTQYQAKVNATAGKLQTYRDATTARQSAQTNFDAVIQTAVKASQLAANQFNASITEDIQQIVALQNYADTVLKPVRDSNLSAESRAADFSTDINTQILPGMRVDFDSYDLNIFGPKQTNYRGALQTYQDTDAAITRFMTLNTADLNRLADTIIPLLAGGRPTKSERLLFLEGHVPYLQNTITVYFPQAIASAQGSQTSAQFTVDSLAPSIAADSAISKQLATDQTNSSLAVQFYNAMVTRLNTLQADVGESVKTMTEIEANLKTFMIAAMNSNASLYLSIFRTQRTFFQNAAATAASAKTTAMSQATRDLAPTNFILANTPSLDSMIKEQSDVTGQIYVFDQLITDTRANASRFTSQKAVVYATDTLNNYVRDYVDVASGRINTINQDLNTNRGSRDRIRPSLAGLQTARDTANTNLGNATTARSNDSNRLLTVTNTRDTNNTRVLLLRGALRVANVPATRLLLQSSRITQFNNDRIALYDAREKGTSNIKTQRSADAQAASEARTAALAASSLITANVPTLATTSSNLTAANRDLASLDTQLPVLAANLQDANQRTNIFRNLMGATTDRLAAFQTQMSIVGAYLAGVNQDMGSVLTRVANYLMSNNVDLAGATKQRKETSDNLDFAQTARQEQDETVNELEDDNLRNRSLIQDLQGILNELGTRNKGAIQTMIDIYRSARNTYRQIRRDANAVKFNAQITNEGFIAASDLFNVAASLNEKTPQLADTLAALPGVEASLQAALAEGATAKNQADLLRTIRDEYTGKQITKLEQANAEIGRISGLLDSITQTMGGIIIRVTNYLGTTPSLSLASSNLDAATKQRDAANVNLQTVQTSKTNTQTTLNGVNAALSKNTSLFQSLQALVFPLTNKQNYRQVYNLAIQSYRDMRTSLQQTRDTFKGAKTASQTTNTAFLPSSDLLQSAASLAEKTPQLASTNTQLATTEATLQTAQKNQKDASTALAILTAMKNETVAQQAIVTATTNLETATAAYDTAVSQAPKPTVDGATVNQANQARDQALQAVATTYEQRMAAATALEGAQTQRTRLQNFYYLITNFGHYLRTTVIQTASKTDLEQSMKAFQADKTAANEAAAKAASEKVAANTEAATAKATATEQDIPGVASTLQSKSTDRAALLALEKDVANSITYAQFLFDLAAGNSTTFTLAEFNTKMANLMALLQSIQNDIANLNLSQDAAAIDLQNSVKQLQDMLAALNATRASREGANQALFAATRDRDSGAAAKKVLLETRQQLDQLLDVLGAFNQTINDRLTQKSMLGGLANYFRSLKNQYKDQYTINRTNKEDLAKAIAELDAPTKSSVNAMLDMARELDMAGALDASIAAKIELNLQLIETWKNVRDDAIMQKIANQTETLKSLMEKMLAEQRKLDDANLKMDGLNESIRKTENLLNDPTLSVAQRDELRRQLELLLKQRDDLRNEISRIRDEMSRLRDRIKQLLNELIGLRQLLTRLKNRLPMFAFFPFAATIAAVGVAGLAAAGIYGIVAGTDKGPTTDCEAAKAQGYKDGYAQGAKDGFAKGYADAKAQYEKDRNALLLGTFGMGEEEVQEPEPEDDTQAGGADTDAEEVEEPEEDSGLQATQLPTNYTVPEPATIPTPSASQIKVPQLPGVTPEYQFCYQEGYIQGYKDGFNAMYLKGFRSFIPSQTAFLPPLQEQEPEEEAPTQENFGPAPGPTGEAEVETDDRIPVDVVYPVPNFP
jgi:hypothetical protein